jgi:hypothetical protein
VLQCRKQQGRLPDDDHCQPEREQTNLRAAAGMPRAISAFLQVDAGKGA